MLGYRLRGLSFETSLLGDFLVWPYIPWDHAVIIKDLYGDQGLAWRLELWVLKLVREAVELEAVKPGLLESLGLFASTLVPRDLGTWACYSLTV